MLVNRTGKPPQKPRFPPSPEEREARGMRANA